MRFFHYDAFPDNTVSWIYFHALANDFMGYDIPTMKEQEEIPVGETEVEIENQNGEVNQAICVTWMYGTQKKGLIVLKRDSPSLHYARKCAARNAAMI
jgi:hypothetical protein